jgi:5'-nucleotidase
MLDFVTRRSASRGCRTQAQVAGVWFDMVCSGDCPDGRGACAKNIVLGENCRGGDPDGPLVAGRCAPLVPTALYRVAVNDFIARGGSGFEVLERNTSQVDTGISLRDALTDFLRDQAPCRDNVVDTTDRNGGTVVERFGAVACLDSGVEPHDGRIRPVFE